MTSPEVTVQVKFFASLRESLGVSELRVSIPNNSTVGQVLKEIEETKDMDIRLIDTQHLCVSVNQQLVASDHVVSHGDEIAFFPPITGG